MNKGNRHQMLDAIGDWIQMKEEIMTWTYTISTTLKWRINFKGLTIVSLVKEAKSQQHLLRLSQDSIICFRIVNSETRSWFNGNVYIFLESNESFWACESPHNIIGT